MKIKLKTLKRVIREALAPDACPDCMGSGEYVGFNDVEPCKSCGGSGKKDGVAQTQATKDRWVRISKEKAIKRNPEAMSRLEDYLDGEGYGLTQDAVFVIDTQRQNPEELYCIWDTVLQGHRAVVRWPYRVNRGSQPSWYSTSDINRDEIKQLCKTP